MIDETNTGSVPEETDASALSENGLEDFFGQSSQDTVNQPTEGAEAQPALEQPAVEPAPAATPTAASPVDPQTASELEALRAEIAQMKVGTQKVEDKVTQPDPLTSVPEYNFEVPTQVIEQLNHEDPAVRSRALSATISATARVVHQQVLNQMNARFEAVLQQIPQIAGTVQSEAETQKQVTTDFYGKYPEYNTPMLRPLVQLGLVEVAKANPELAATGWTPALRDKLGEYLKANVPLVVPAPAKVPATKTPPKMMNQGARPASPQLSGDEAALAEMFG